jgi:hypothetical protein
MDHGHHYPPRTFSNPYFGGGMVGAGHVLGILFAGRDETKELAISDIPNDRFYPFNLCTKLFGDGPALLN